MCQSLLKLHASELLISIPLPTNPSPEKKKTKQTLLRHLALVKWSHPFSHKNVRSHYFFYPLESSISNKQGLAFIPPKQASNPLINHCILKYHPSTRHYINSFSKPVKQPPTHLLLPSIAPLHTSSQHDRKISITSCHCPGPKLFKSFSLHLLLNPKSLPYTTTWALSVFAP